MPNVNSLSLMVGAVITLVGLVVFSVPFKGAQQTTYGLFLLGGLLYSFLIEEGVSGQYRGKGINIFGLSKVVITYILPPILVMIQSALLFTIFSKYADAMQDKDASGNLPGILTTYSTASFVVVCAEMILLHMYTSKILRGGSHPSMVIRMAEKALTPGFVGLGSVGFLFIGLLYTVITRFLTDG